MIYVISSAVANRCLMTAYYLVFQMWNKQKEQIYLFLRSRLIHSADYSVTYHKS